MFIPCGDTVIIEQCKKGESIVLPENITHQEGDMYIVKSVGKGYVTEQGQVIPPEVKEGDKVVICGKILSVDTPEGKLLIARAQDILLYERPGFVSTNEHGKIKWKCNN